MAEIKVVNTRVDVTNIDTTYFTGNVPILDIMKNKYWNGTEEEYSEFLAKHEIKPYYNFKTITELQNITNEIIKKLLVIFPREISKFDVKIIPVMKQKSLKPVTDEDYDLLTFELKGFSEEEKEVFIDAFFNIFSLSIYDFKKLEDDKLLLFYNRRGFAEDDDRISLAQARTKVTLLQNFKVPKDNNFICADFVLQMAKIMTKRGFSLENTFFYYVQGTPNGDIREWKKSLNEILEAPNMSTEEIELEKEKERIKQEAQEELKKEMAEKRQSLPPESTKIELAKASSSQVKNGDILTADINLDEMLRKISEEYDAKEIEKTKLRLAEANKESVNIYEMMKELLSRGTTVLEVLNIAKQKARYTETVQKASFFLTRDLLEVQQKDLIIEEANKEVLLRENEIKKLTESLIKREETISDLRGTINRKNIEITNLVDKHEKDIENITNETQKTIDMLNREIMDYKSQISTIMEKYEKDIENMISAQKETISKRENEFQSLMMEQSSLIDKLEMEKAGMANFIEENKKLQSKQEEKIDRLTRENAVLLENNNRLKELEKKVEILEKENLSFLYENKLLREKAADNKGSILNFESSSRKERENEDYDRVENIISKNNGKN